MATSKPKLQLKVPKGFYNIMEVFLTDLLKNKPQDIYDYGAQFFEKLLQNRSETGYDPAVHGPRAEEGFKDSVQKRGKHGKKPEASDTKVKRTASSVVDLSSSKSRNDFEEEESDSSDVESDSG